LSKARSVITGALILVGIVAALYKSWPQQSRAAQAGAPAQPVPVAVAAVERKDMPVYLTGLGTVRASQTIAIHPQVEGQLLEVLFTEGQQVKKGDVLAKIDPRLFLAALNQAKARQAQDAALLVAAEKDLNRAVALGKEKIVSQQIIEERQARYGQLKAAIAADIAAIETAQTQLDYTTIRAPSAGRVGIRRVDAGNLVRLSNAIANAIPITTLVVTRPSAILFTLPAGNLDDIRAALARGSVEVIALDQDNQRVLSTGKLLLIDNSIDASTSTIQLKAMFDNTDDRLWPGEFVNARLLVEERRNALTIPTTAVQRGPSGLLVWVALDKMTVEPRTIKTGPSANDLTVVTEGLSEGEIVVTEGQYRLQAGARVAAAPSPPKALQNVK
jgi:membrane fusion protein, multidrug efflux system